MTAVTDGQLALLDAPAHPPTEAAICGNCGEAMILRGRGRRRRFCSDRCRTAAHRRRLREAAGLVPSLDERPRAAVEDLAAASDPAAAVALWSRAALRVPAGHPRAGQPMELPPYAVAFLADALQPGCREALLSTGRKNAKSAIAAVLTLAYLAGPLRRPGLRIGTASLTREKAGELLRQCRAIAEASGLPGLDFRRSPAPGWIAAAGESSAEFLSADKSSGHAAGFDLALIDELGLMTERDRELVAGMRTATSARDGRLLALSVRGESPLLQEMLDRQDLDTCAVHLHAPDDDAPDIHDPAVWAAGNPGIACGIKSATWMADEARRVAATPADRATFEALDLNLRRSPARQAVVTLADWEACARVAAPPREGPAVVGLDLGGSTSMSAAAICWPSVARLEVRVAFPDTPDLARRGQADGVGSLYSAMQADGCLRTYPGRVMDVEAFLRDLLQALAGVEVREVGFDRFRKAEAEQALDDARVPWRRVPRGQGASATADGSHDVRAFQRLVESHRLRIGAGDLALRAAVREASLRFDGAGNPALDKSRQKGRIDALQAAVIACGLGELLPAGELRIVL